MDHRAVCRGALEAKGVFREPWLARAFDAVDREDYVPDRAWVPERDARGTYRFIDRGVDREAWRRAVWDPHRSVVTQMDDGKTPPTGPALGDFSSSVSAPDIVFEKLGHLELGTGHTVLDVGYGSGCHTAYLCERVGQARVTGVEVDHDLAERGATNLKRAGFAPHLVCGDGLAGVPERAPFDRVISTASLHAVPSAWVEQVAEGGLILTPFGTAYENAGLLRLRVARGVARGRFVGSASYMWLRGQRPPRVLDVAGECVRRPSPIDPDQVLGGGCAQAFAIGLQVPDASYSHRGEGNDRKVQFVDGTGTSVAIVRYTDWWAGDAVRVWGPRDLWDEVVRSFTWYQARRRPDITRFGVTVDCEGQRFWLDEPDRPVAL
ncbi:Protein-L-isoaspartate O-methyltransferase [Streptomyces hundungensis]|uniref:Protein-L-isoaspartate O-methyltransferase n=1 Tax=Streptomyces hundungensis TaxID=1077946 RepID=A0A387HM43_9ACTN|nr:methyltransferase domain-containing protein [Streptomyces hundungensis]AYG81890.1 Protein-L-isoaspartate O-methyltransferase [Streptomyces hundungensis]